MKPQGWYLVFLLKSGAFLNCWLEDESKARAMLVILTRQWVAAAGEGLAVVGELDHPYAVLRYTEIVAIYTSREPRAR